MSQNDNTLKKLLNLQTKALQFRSKLKEISRGETVEGTLAEEWLQAFDDILGITTITADGKTKG